MNVDFRIWRDFGSENGKAKIFSRKLLFVQAAFRFYDSMPFFSSRGLFISIVYCFVFLSGLDAAVVRMFFESEESTKTSIVSSKFGEDDRGMSTVI